MNLRRIIGMSLAASCTAIVGVAATTWITANAEPSYVRLHLGSDAQRFTFGTQTQPLAFGKNSCALTSASLNGLIALSSTSGSSNSAPGLANYGLGVKAAPSSGNGSPCAQIDSAESLTLSRGTSLATRTFRSVRLDLEMTGNAVVTVRLTGTSQFQDFTLQTGNSIDPNQMAEADLTPPYVIDSTTADPIDACAAPNSSGPNSGGNDNCQWLITPNFNFTSVRITTSGGTVSLEGGADFGNDPNFDTLFELSNSAPVANPDSPSTNEDFPVTFNVLANDTDADGNELSVQSFTPVSSGTLTQGAGGQFTYTPVPNASGTATFSYTATDGVDTSTAIVTITINPVNDPPQAQSSNTTTPEETPKTITVASDIDGPTINASCTVAPPSAGSVTDNHDGTVTFTPALNFVGPVTLTCTISDSLVEASLQATITVGVTNLNDAPVAVADSAEVNQNRSGVPLQSVLIDVVDNDTDVDAGAVLAAAAVTSPPSSGTAVVEAGQIRYTPTAGFVGTDSFQYVATDGQANSNAATVTVQVFQVMCSQDTVTDTDGAVSASFFRLTDIQSCKRYTLEADDATSSVLFQPVAVAGAPDVKYRGVITLGPKPAPGPAGVLSLKLEYDPLGGTSFQPVQWCDNPTFDSAGVVTNATPPSGESWCVASESTQGSGTTSVITTWQVFGIDDPRFQ